jgi:hypothetical protein
MKKLPSKTNTAAPDKEPRNFKNVAVLLDDHAILAQLAKAKQRTMARQLSVLIRKAFDELEKAS